LQAGIQGELELEVVPVERSSLQAIGERGTVAPSAHAESALLALEILIPTLFQSSLGNTIQVQKTNHVGEKVALGVNPLGIGFKIEPADLKLPYFFGGFWIKIGGQLHTAFTIADVAKEICLRLSQNLREFGSYLLGVASVVSVVSKKAEILRVGPEGEALFINRYHPTCPVHDGAPLSKWLDGLGLDLAGFLLEGFPLHHLQPDETKGQSSECQAKQAVDPQKAFGRRF
jgi:hypothetical protein